MVTINEIAKLAGVSKATVSKALNDRGDISSKTKRKIKKIAKEIGYIPNSIAKSLVMKKTYTIGLILPYLGNPTTMERIKGIQDTLFKNRFILVTCFSEKKDREIYIKEMISRKVDGIILTPVMNSIKEVDILLDKKIPFVLMSENIEEGNFDFVGDDDFYGGKIATEHLIKIGHKKIAYFGVGGNIYSDNQIKKGYMEKLNEYGIKEKYIIENDNDRNRLKENIIEVVKKGVTGIICWSDLMAINLINILEGIKLKIPDDISVIGYDNIDFLSIFHIPLTTVSQPNYEIGKYAAILITERIKNPDAKPKKIIFKPELVVRKTTKEVKNV